MKHAYLIMAHNKFEQLKFLISLLDYKDNDIFIMIDEKVDNNVFNDIKKELENFCEFSKVYFLKRSKIFWGGMSLITAEMSLFKESHKNNYDYFHLLSGVDLPLISQENLHKFFEENKGKIFLTNVSGDLFIKNNIENRVKYKYLFSNMQVRNTSNKSLKKLINIYRKLELKIQKILKVNRFEKYNVKLGYASNWLSLDNETVKILIEEENFITEVFKNSIIADELFVPTVINKRNLQQKIYFSEGVNDKQEEFQGNLRYINWWDGSPYEWSDSEKDLKQLENARKMGHLFSRKFDLEKYPKYKEIIKEWTK